MTSSNPNYLPKVPSPNTTLLGVGASTLTGVWDTNIQFKKMRKGHNWNSPVLFLWHHIASLMHVRRAF